MFARIVSPLLFFALIAACSSSSNPAPTDDGGGGGDDGGDDGGDTTPPATTEDGLTELDRALFSEDPDALFKAEEIFRAILDRDSEDDLARTMVAGLQLVNFLDRNEDLETFAEDFGVVGSTDAFAILDVEFPDMLPDDSPRLDELQSWAGRELLPLMKDSIDLLDGVSTGFDETLVFELDPDDPDDDEELVLDFPLVKAATGALRVGVAAVEITQVFNLEVDIDRVVNTRFGEGSGFDVPYRIFSGGTPTSPEMGATCPTDFAHGSVERPGVFNDSAATGSNFFLVNADADDHLESAQDALAQSIRDIVEGIDGLLPLDTSDCTGDEFDSDEFDDPEDLEDIDVEEIDFVCLAAELVPLYEDALRDWLLDVADAIDGIDDDVDPVFLELDDLELELEGFSLDAGILFSPLTWDGRFFLPDYTISGGCVATADSFVDPTLSGLLPEVTGEDWLLIWNAFNSLRDTLAVGEPLNVEY